MPMKAGGQARPWSDSRPASTVGAYGAPRRRCTRNPHSCVRRGRPPPRPAWLWRALRASSDDGLAHQPSIRGRCHRPMFRSREHGPTRFSELEAHQSLRGHMLTLERGHRGCRVVLRRVVHATVSRLRATVVPRLSR